MSDSPKSIRVPADLKAAAEGRAQALGYRSFSEYVRGLVRYDLMCGGPHSLTLPISNKPLTDQDALDAFLLRLSEEGGSVRAQLFEALLKGDRRDPDGLQPDKFLEFLFEEVNTNTKPNEL